MSRNFVLLTILLLAMTATSSSRGVVETNELLIPGKCKKQWRNDELKGRCFGLEPHTTYKHSKEMSLNITSAAQCRALCCNLAAACVSWQWESTMSKCKLGGKVRLGLEATGTSEWCDPHPVSDWNGKKLAKRKSDGTCEWGENLRKQCFGLGPERMAANGDKLDTLHCARECCKLKTCTHWQEIPGRGCFYSDGGEDPSCSTEPKMVFTGARKCLPGYCAGQEAKHGVEAS